MTPEVLDGVYRDLLPPAVNHDQYFESYPLLLDPRIGAEITFVSSKEDFGFYRDDDCQDCDHPPELLLPSGAYIWSNFSLETYLNTRWLQKALMIAANTVIDDPLRESKFANQVWVDPRRTVCPFLLNTPDLQGNAIFLLRPFNSLDQLEFGLRLMNDYY